jgi:serine/threonine protein kinase
MLKDLPIEIQDFIKNHRKLTAFSTSSKGGNCYLVFAKDEILNRKVAMKFIYGEYKQIAEEPSVLSNLNHENIITIYEAKLLSDNLLYFMTPIAEQGDLEDFMRSNQISIKEALSITNDILNGLNQLHKIPVTFVHRDIKPANILMAGNIPKVSDLGSIRKIDSVESYSDVSEMTLFYKTPESLNNRHYVKSDIYQVGLILFQLLGGKINFVIEDYLNKKQIGISHSIIDMCDKANFEDEIILKKISKGKFLDFSNLPSYLPKKVKRILFKATTHHFSKRYSSVTEMMYDITNCINEVPDWKAVDKRIYLQNYQGKTYKIRKLRDSYFTFQKKQKSSNWRKIKESKADDLLNCVKLLKKKLKI